MKTDFCILEGSPAIGLGGSDGFGGSGGFAHSWAVNCFDVVAILSQALRAGIA